MKKIKYFQILAISVFVCLNTQAQTADEIIGKYAAALGGIDKIMELKALKVSGSMKMMGMEFPYTNISVHPRKNYLEVSVQGQIMKQGYDGAKGWIINPMTGGSGPEEADEETIKQMKTRGRTISELFTYKEDGAAVELLESEPVEGVKVFKIKYTGTDGKIVNYYVDAEKYLLIKTDKTVSARGIELFAETTFSNYKEFGGVLFSTINEMKTKDSQMGNQTIYIDKVEINPEIDVNIFQMPVK
jgi:hypothetical protein